MKLINITPREKAVVHRMRLEVVVRHGDVQTRHVIQGTRFEELGISVSAELIDALCEDTTRVGRTVSAVREILDDELDSEMRATVMPNKRR